MVGPFYLLISNRSLSVALHPYSLARSIFLIVTTRSVRVWGYLLVVLILNILITNDVEHLFCAYFLFVYFLWRNVCSNFSPFLDFFLLLSLESSLYTIVYP